jgi:hypothetical protein
MRVLSLVFLVFCSRQQRFAQLHLPAGRQVGVARLYYSTRFSFYLSACSATKLI